MVDIENEIIEHIDKLWGWKWGTREIVGFVKCTRYMIYQYASYQIRCHGNAKSNPVQAFYPDKSWTDDRDITIQWVDIFRHFQTGKVPAIQDTLF